MWFSRRAKQQKQLDTLEAHLFNVKKRLREVKRELAEFKKDQLNFERKQLLKLGRIEGMLGIGLSSSLDESASNPDMGFEFQKRRQEEEAERIALEQLGTGGSAQSVSHAITSKDEEAEGA